MKTLIFLLTLCLAATLHAQTADTSAIAGAEPYITKEFVIVTSTKNYSQALATAKTAAQKLKAPLKLRGLKPSKATGLTLPRKQCEEYWEYPCYIARGRYDDGVYTSIEYSSQYEGFAEGYYIVIVASGGEGDAATAAALKKTKAAYADAYRKKSRVYIGCIH
jgi:hypothetical protein